LRLNFANNFPDAGVTISNIQKGKRPIGTEIGYLLLINKIAFLVSTVGKAIFICI